MVIRRAVTDFSVASLYYSETRTTLWEVGSGRFRLSLHQVAIDMERGRYLAPVYWLEFVQGHVISQCGFILA